MMPLAGLFSIGPVVPQCGMDKDCVSTDIVKERDMMLLVLMSKDDVNIISVKTR